MFKEMQQAILRADLPTKAHILVLYPGHSTQLIEFLYTSLSCERIVVLAIDPETKISMERRLAQIGASSVEVLEADIHHLYFKREFDAVIVPHSSWKMPKIERTVVDIRSVLKPEGKLLLFDALLAKRHAKELFLEKERAQMICEYAGCTSIQPLTRGKDQYGIMVVFP
jgi:SAM-dependent methyltransferase